MVQKDRFFDKNNLVYLHKFIDFRLQLPYKWRNNALTAPSRLSANEQF